LNEDPYFSFLNNEPKSVEENDLKTSNNNNDDLSIFDDELYDVYDTDDDNIPPLTNNNNNNNNNNNVQQESASKTDIVLLEKANSAEQNDANSDDKEISSANSNENNESLDRIQGILIAIQNFPLPSAADLDIVSPNDYNNIINDIKVDQNEQNLKMLSNELSSLSMRLVDIEKILIQSFQLDLMIILMFILLISLILFRVFFMEKRNKFILMGGRGRVSRVTTNGQQCHEKCMNGFEKMDLKN
jgi:hypothetical protein